MTYYPKELNDGRHVFVFGSNLSGIHGAGAALEAVRHWGYEAGFATGRIGNAYAIPTRAVLRRKGGLQFNTLPVADIAPYVDDFIIYANHNPQLKFLVTRIGCGLAGLKDEEIAPLFKSVPANVELPKEWEEKRKA